MVASRGLAKSRKSGSGGQGFEVEACSKGVHKKMIASRALARFCKNVDLDNRGLKLMFLAKKLISKW